MHACQCIEQFAAPRPRTDRCYRDRVQRVERRATIPGAPEEVFAYLSDLENLPAWQTGVVEARLTSTGPIGIGSTAHVVRELMGQRIEAPLTVTEYEPPRRMVVDSKVGGVGVSIALDLAAADLGTEVGVTAEIRGSGLTAFMEPMIASAAGSDLAVSLDRLRSALAPGAEQP
jgi:carbon monoxide dehydrogenase subunit G